MFLKEIKKTYFTPVYNLNGYTSTRELSGELSNCVQNSASVVPAHNYILFIQAKRVSALGFFSCAKSFASCLSF